MTCTQTPREGYRMGLVTQDGRPERGTRNVLSPKRALPFLVPRTQRGATDGQRDLTTRRRRSLGRFPLRQICPNQLLNLAPGGDQPGDASMLPRYHLGRNRLTNLTGAACQPCATCGTTAGKKSPDDDVGGVAIEPNPNAVPSSPGTSRTTLVHPEAPTPKRS